MCLNCKEHLEEYLQKETGEGIDESLLPHMPYDLYKAICLHPGCNKFTRFRDYFNIGIFWAQCNWNWIYPMGLKIRCRWWHQHRHYHTCNKHYKLYKGVVNPAGYNALTYAENHIVKIKRIEPATIIDPNK